MKFQIGLDGRKKIKEEDLREFFTPYGEVISAEVIRDRQTGLSRGYGFVVMRDEKAGRPAIAELHEGKVEGNIVTITEARPGKPHRRRN